MSDISLRQATRAVSASAVETCTIRKEAARKVGLSRARWTNFHVPRSFVEGHLPRRKLKHVAGPIASTSSSVLPDPTCRTRLPETWPSKERRLERFNFTCHSGQGKLQEAVKS